MRRVTKGGKTYVVRGDRLIEIDGVPVRGVDAKAIKATRGQRHIGVPWDYLADVLRRIPKAKSFSSRHCPLDLSPHHRLPQSNSDFAQYGTHRIGD
jgi:hypothetical protein